MHEIYRQDVISERHRHRYEVNVNYKDRLEQVGLRFSGMSPDGVLPEIVEIPDHPWFIGVQYHPELKSRPFAPHPLFTSFIGAAKTQSRLFDRGEAHSGSYFRQVLRVDCAMTRKLLLAALGLLTLATAAWAQTAAQSPYGKVERRDPIFLRFPEMAERFWVNTETMAASHKSVAVPMPKQCAFVYADTYTRNQMSEREVQHMALSNCNAKLNQLGPLGENYAVALPVPGDHQRRCLCGAARDPARPGLRAGLDLLSRRSRQRRPAQRHGALRRLDRPRPLGDLLGRQSARRAGLRRHLHQ